MSSKVILPQMDKEGVRRPILIDMSKDSGYKQVPKHLSPINPDAAYSSFQALVPPAVGGCCIDSSPEDSAVLAGPDRC